MYLRKDLREIPSSLDASPMLLCPSRTAGKIRAKPLFSPLRSITLGLPILLPCRLALSIPAMTRSRIISSSNSARDARRFSSSLPNAVDVSNCSRTLLKDTPTASQARRVSCMSLTDRKARPEWRGIG